jgi:hypothetical protein
MPTIQITVNTLATQKEGAKIAEVLEGFYCDILVVNNTATGIIYLSTTSPRIQGEGIPIAATTGVYSNDHEIESLFLHAAVDGTIVQIKYSYRPVGWG